MSAAAQQATDSTRSGAQSGGRWWRAFAGGFASSILAHEGAHVVAFDWQSPDQIGVEALRKAIGLHLIARFADGSVFAANP